MTNKEQIVQTRDEIIADGVVFCVRLGTAAGVVDVCRAAIRGGVRVLEITMTTPGALEVIRELRDDDAIVGGGTVMTPADARAIAEAGGRFALSPVFDADMVDEAHILGLFAVPGATTPSEIVAAHRHGAHMVKVFPAGPLGGPGYLRAIRGPLPGVRLLATTGPTSENLAEYFDAGATAVGIGAEILHPGFTIASVEKVARKIRSAVKRARA